MQRTLATRRSRYFAAQIHMGKMRLNGHARAAPCAGSLTRETPWRTYGNEKGLTLAR